MNYRHAYHAGNHADVLKHIVVARIIQHLVRKDKAFRALDLHAGRGTYALESPEALKTLEWQDGVGRLYHPDGTPRPLVPEAEDLILPWRRAIAACNPSGPLQHYPGSPRLIRHLLRRHDRLILNELHPEDGAALAMEFARDRQVSVTRLDATIAIKAQLPPPERRGFILVDPPYERTDEVERILAMLADGVARFQQGIYGIWYPVTGDGLDARLADGLRLMPLQRLLQVELRIRAVRSDGGLAGSGLCVVNAPWQLDRELGAVLPALRAALHQDETAAATVRMLTDT
jgi:23S rRNA (adenine2030-N6)-methyltransferase